MHQIDSFFQVAPEGGLHVREFAAKIGATAVGSSPAQFDTFLKSERARWKKVIADAGIKAE